MSATGKPQSLTIPLPVAKSLPLTIPTDEDATKHTLGKYD